MIKKLFLTFLLGLTLTAAFAQDNINKMKVVMTDGSEIVYALIEEPNITFSDDNLVVTVGSHVYNHPLQNLQRYEILAVNKAGVDNITAERSSIKRSGDIITIEKTTPGAEIAIYGVGGEMLFTTKANAQGNATLSLENLAGGIYILKVNDTATKISK